MADRGTVRRRGRGFGARGGFKRQQQREDDGHDHEEQENEAPEVKSLREKHGESVPLVQAVFPEWDEVSVLYAISEAHGSVELAISRIVEGQAEQWGSVKPKKQQKKEASSTEAAHEGQSSSGGVSGRGSFGGRGRGRGDFRGGRAGFRGGARGGRGGAVAGRPQPANGEVTVTEVTEVAVNVDGTTTATTVTEAEGQGVTEVSIKESSTDAQGTTVQVEETVSVVERPQQATKLANGAQKGKGPASAAPASAPKKAAPTGAKLSWAQIARPPSPKPQPAPVPKAAPVEATPAPAPTAEAAPAPVESVVVAEIVAEEPEPVILVSEVEVPAQEATQTAPQDPWSSTPAAAVLSSEEQQQPAEPTALAVGEGWADSIIARTDYEQAQQATPEEQAAQEAQHQRAEEAAPPAGVNPAGALDVHTPGPNELPSQPAATQSMAPPGLSKRASAVRGKQDAPVVMPGATPDIERMGVQFGSLNLFGSIPAASDVNAQEEAPLQSQQSLYESVPVQQQQQQPQQQEVQQAPAAYDIQQQAQAQYYQSQAQKQQQQQPSQYGGGVFDRFGAQQQPQQHYQAPQQQQQQQAPSSAYSSRYQPFGQPAQQPQQAQDPFASITSPYQQNIARTGSAQQQHQANVPSLGGVDSISPYYSSQQAQNLQSHHATQAPQSAASPAPQNARDSAGSVPPQQAASAYGGFTSAIGQQTQPQQQQHQQGYPTDYSSFYGMQDQTRNLQGYYGQTEQAAQQPYRPSATDDLTAKLGASSATAASGLGAQPQQQQQLGQQQQHYNPNMMGGYNYPYYPYGGGYGNPSYGGYPGYPSQQYGYGGYNQTQNRSAYQGATGANHSQQSSTGAPNNTYSRNSGLGGYGNNAAASAGLGGSAGASNYGSNAYGSFDSSRNGQSGAQGLGQGQQDRSASAGDAFNDPRYSTQY